MQLVAGVVQLLIFQHLALLMARAKPLNDVPSLHTHVSICNDSITSIMSQIHSLIMDMHLKAKERFSTYAHSQNFNDRHISHLCHTELSEFPKFSLNRTSSEEEKLIELYKIFHYMSTAMGNITKEQEKDLNSNNKILHKQLNTSKEEIAAVISNLSCVLNKRYKAPIIEVYYKVPRNIMLKKINGCKVLHKYERFLTQASNITGDWGKNGEYTQDPSSDKLTPDHR